MKKELLILLINKWWISVEPDTSFMPVTLSQEIKDSTSLSFTARIFWRQNKNSKFLKEKKW